MKKTYEKPELEIIVFETEDFCNSSSPDIGDY
jgi:hypothetical protein